MSVTLLCFLTTTIISVYSLGSLITSNARSLTKLLSSSIYDAVRNEIIGTSSMSRVIANDRFSTHLLRIESAYPTDYVTDRVADYLEGVKKGIDFDTAFLASYHTRRVFNMDHSLSMVDQEVAKNDIFQDIISSGRPRIPLIQRKGNPQKEFFFVISRINDEEGRLLGLCGVGINTDRIKRILSEFEKNYNVSISLFDWNKRLIISGSDKKLGSLFDADLPERFMHDRHFTYKEEDDGSYIIVQYIGEVGWFLCIEGEKMEGREAYSDLILRNILALIVIFLLLFVCNHYIMSTDRQHLQHKANTDPLTGIHNRSGFQFLLKNCLAKSKGGGALFILDLDHFKQVNDTLGHPTGDLLLKDIAQILQGIFRSNDIVARLGGDEFVIYADGLEENSTIKDKAEMIIQKCTRDYTQPDGTVFSVTASIGIACYPQDGATLKDLYKHADEALYSAKKDGRNRFTFYQAP